MEGLSGKTVNIEETKKKRKKMPNAFVILFYILVFMSVMTYIIPSGEFQKEMMSNGRMGVIPGSYSVLEKTSAMKVSFWDFFKAIPKGMIQSASIVMLVFFAGGMFEVVESTKVIEKSIGILVEKIERKNISKSLTIVILTGIFGFFGAAIGFENLIPFVPLGAMIALGLGYDLMVGAAIVIGGIAVGFATSPINPYTVGVSHGIAGLPIFSGMGLRALFCFSALLVLSHHTIKYSKKIVQDPSKSFVLGISTEGFNIKKTSHTLDGRGKLIVSIFSSFIIVIIFGVIKYKWYLTEISALFIVYTILIGIAAKISSDELISTFMRGAGKICGGALIIGFARAISIIMTQGKIADTVINTLATPIAQFPPVVSAILMTLVQGVINFFIPSGSGQAMATMPIIIPLSDIIGISRQTAILAFQIGDGFVNMIIPTLGGLMAMLAIGRIPYDKWVKFIFPLVLKLYVLGWIFLGIAISIKW